MSTALYFQAYVYSVESASFFASLHSQTLPSHWSSSNITSSMHSSLMLPGRNNHYRLWISMARFLVFVHSIAYTLLVQCLVAQSCLTLCNPMCCSPPGSSVHWDSPCKNTRVGCHALLPWRIPCPESSQPRDRTQVSLIAGGFFTRCATKEVEEYWSGAPIPSPGTFPTQELNQSLLHCWQILYLL